MQFYKRLANSSWNKNIIASEIIVNNNTEGMRMFWKLW